MQLARCLVQRIAHLFCIFLLVDLCLRHAVVDSAVGAEHGFVGSALIPKSRLRSLVLVSTLDGQISALDAAAGTGHGSVLWTVPSPSGPLFASSLSNVEFTDKAGSYSIIPALDGHFYSFREGELKAVPVDVDALFAQATSLSDGSSIVGAKDKVSYGIDPDTGTLEYVCSAQGCKIQEREEGDPTPIGRSDVLVIQRLQKTVRAYNKRHGMEKWNISVGEVAITLEEGDELEEEFEFCEGSDAIHDWQLRLAAAEGIVVSFNEANGDLLWQHQFSSPIANVWTLKGTCLLPWDMFHEKASLATANKGIDSQRSPYMYMGTHRNQMYVQTSPTMTQAVHGWMQAVSERERFAQMLIAGQSTICDIHSGRSIPGLPQISKIDTSLQLGHITTDDCPSFYPSVDPSRPLGITSGKEAAAGSGAPTLAGKAITVSTELIVHQPMGPGVYFYHTLPLQACIGTSKDKLCFPAAKPPKRSPKAPKPIAYNTSVLAHLPVIAVLMVISAAGGLFGYRHYIKHHKKEGRKLQEPVDVVKPESDGNNTSKEDASLSDALPSPDKALETFQSRFENDFEKIKKLGKGGFGIVFQVRKRFDGQPYAVKRVSLREGVDNRVMREVNALATLEHVNIVRYFNSWVEEMPPGRTADDDLDGGDGDDEDDEEDGVSDELSDMVSDLLSPDSTDSPREHNRRYNHFRYPSDNESSGGIVFGFPSGTNSTDSSGVIFSPGHAAPVDNPVIVHPAQSGLPSHLARPSNVRFDRTISSSSSSSLATPIVLEGTSQQLDRKSSPIIGNGGVANLDGYSMVEEDNSFSSNQLDNGYSEGSDTSDDSSAHSTAQFDTSWPASPSTSSSPALGGSDTSSSIIFSPTEQLLAETASIPVARGGTAPMLLSSSSRDPSLSISARLAAGKSATTESNNVLVKPRRRKRAKRSLSEHSDTPRVYLYIQMQLCQEMDLKGWLLRNVDGRCLREATSIFLQIVRAVGYVHDNKVMHRDLKPSNVFFSPGGRVKVGDFGLATASGHHRNMSRDDLHALACEYDDSNNEMDHTGQVGTEIYMSPELMIGQKYSEKVDIFSLGIMFAELLTPFDTQSERVQVLLKIRKFRFPKNLTQDQVDIIKLLVVHDPADRLSARELYQQPIFRDVIAQEAAGIGW